MFEVWEMAKQGQNSIDTLEKKWIDICKRERCYFCSVLKSIESAK